MGQGKRGHQVGNGLYKQITCRNIGFLTESEQEKLRQSSVAIAGVGGVGGLLAERLIRLGIGRLKVLDPEDFELSNFNRQFCSSMATLGRNKAEVLYEHLKDINPEAKIQYSKAGIRTERNATLFVSDCDVVVDAMDFGLFRESIYLQRECRRKGIYYMFASAIGFGALVVVFDPGGITLEEYNGLPKDVDLDGGEEPTIPIDRICPIIPSYALPFTAEAAAIVGEILAKDRPAPTLSIGVGLASILAANEVANIILRKKEIVCAPRYIYVDLLDRRFAVEFVL